MIKTLGIFGTQAGAALKRTVNDDSDFPWQTFKSFERLGQPFGLLFGECL